MRVGVRVSEGSTEDNYIQVVALLAVVDHSGWTARQQLKANILWTLEANMLPFSSSFNVLREKSPGLEALLGSREPFVPEELAPRQIE